MTEDELKNFLDKLPTMFLRKNAPEDLAKELVDIQPMCPSTTLIFRMRELRDAAPTNLPFGFNDDN